METPPTTESKNFGEEFSDLMRRHPWRYLLLMFLFGLGAFHVISDLVLLVRPSWHLDRAAAYFAAVAMAGSNVLAVRFTKSRKQSESEREAEKRILRQADEILKQAQADAKAHTL